MTGARHTIRLALVLITAVSLGTFGVLVTLVRLSETGAAHDPKWYLRQVLKQPSR